MVSIVNIHNFEDLVAHPSTSIKDVLKLLNFTGQQLVIITDHKNKVLGAITDGDVRRGLISNVSLDDSVTSIMNKDPFLINSEMKDSDIYEVLKLNSIKHLPIVDKNKTLLGLKVLDISQELPHADGQMVIMAGGKGTRLSPMTENCPKPLLVVSGKPIIQHIIENAQKSGISRFFVSVNYLAEQIEDFLGDGSKFHANVTCFREEKPLGTAGALSLIKDELNDHFIVTNGDIITSLNYFNMLDNHIKSASQATMAIRNYTIQNQFGVVETQNNVITGFTEKPEYKSNINAGVYCLSQEVLSLLPHNEFCDMPKLFLRALDSKMRAQIYPLHEPWIDIGNPDDFSTANKYLKSDRTK